MSGNRTVALEDFCDNCGQRNPGEGQMGDACPTCPPASLPGSAPEPGDNA